MRVITLRGVRAMIDIVPPAVRSRMMSSVKSRDTKPELQLRRGLHKAGLRYRLHVAALPGRPDIVFPTRRAVIFVHGCFWHGHSCRKGAVPTSNEEFWLEKIQRNQIRDAKARTQLWALGWRSMTVWECALKNSTSARSTIEAATRWLRLGVGCDEIGFDTLTSKRDDLGSSGLRAHPFTSAVDS